MVPSAAMPTLPGLPVVAMGPTFAVAVSGAMLMCSAGRVLSRWAG
jgi:hypothetical protein